MTKAKRSKIDTDTSSTRRSHELERPAQEEESLLTDNEVKNLADELERERVLRIRALADFDNYRKRVERDRGVAAQSGKRPIILAILDVMDDFDRALDHAAHSSDSIIEGVRAIRKRLGAVLETQGVTPIESVGQPFDPTLHEAIGTVEAEGESGTVMDEVGRGYLWNGELLRPARVRVTK
jgi:molecular chaperone GrpE